MTIVNATTCWFEIIEVPDKQAKTAAKNFKESGDVIPTQKQLIDIVIELKKVPVSTEEIKSINQAFQKTKFGMLCLN